MPPARLSRLEEAEEQLRQQADPDLVAVPLREALEAAGEVVGAADIEEILGEIFSTFCIREVSFYTAILGRSSFDWRLSERTGSSCGRWRFFRPPCCA